MAPPHDLLARIPLLAHVPGEERRRIVEAGQVRSLTKGHVLFREGDRAQAMYALLEGSLKLVRLAPDGKEMLLHLVRRGESFAEAALFPPAATYPATALALEDARVWSLPRARLVQLLEASPELALALLASVSRWTRLLATRLELLTQRRVEERLAVYLVARAERRPVREGDAIDLGEPRHLIAAQIGTAPEVLSRTLRRLEEEGVATFEAHAAIVHRPDALHALAFRGADAGGQGDPEAAVE
jgi:CRP/FNR family transcriptional regulator